MRGGGFGADLQSTDAECGQAERKARRRNARRGKDEMARLLQARRTEANSWRCATASPGLPRDVRTACHTRATALTQARLPNELGPGVEVRAMSPAKRRTGPPNRSCPRSPRSRDAPRLIRGEDHVGSDCVPDIRARSDGVIRHEPVGRARVVTKSSGQTSEQASRALCSGQLSRELWWDPHDPNHRFGGCVRARPPLRGYSTEIGGASAMDGCSRSAPPRPEKRSWSSPRVWSRFK